MFVSSFKAISIMEVTAKIDISTPAGRKIVRELVKFTYPLPLWEDGKTEETFSVDEVFE